MASWLCGCRSGLPRARSPLLPYGSGGLADGEGDILVLPRESGLHVRRRRWADRDLVWCSVMAAATLGPLRPWVLCVAAARGPAAPLRLGRRWWRPGAFGRLPWAPRGGRPWGSTPMAMVPVGQGIAQRKRRARCTSRCLHLRAKAMIIITSYLRRQLRYMDRLSWLTCYKQRVQGIIEEDEKIVYLGLRNIEICAAKAECENFQMLSCG